MCCFLSCSRIVSTIFYVADWRLHADKIVPQFSSVRDWYCCALTQAASRDKFRCDIFLPNHRLRREPLALRYLMIAVSRWCFRCLLMRSTFEATSGDQGFAEGSNFLQGDPGNFAQILHDPVVLWIGSVPLLPYVLQIEN